MNGRSPGFTSYFAVYPEEQLIVVVLSNIYISIPFDIGQSLAALILDESVDLPRMSRSLLSHNHSQKLVGDYQFGDNFYRPNFKLNISAREGKLYSTWGGMVPVNDGTGAPHTFILRPYWSTVQFLPDEEGKIVNMKFDQFEGAKVGETNH